MAWYNTNKATYNLQYIYLHYLWNFIFKIIHSVTYNSRLILFLVLTMPHMEYLWSIIVHH